jgi:hypothetical protein
VPRAADSPRGGYSVGSSRDDYSVVLPVADSLRGDCSVALEPVDFPAGLPVGYRADWRRVVPDARHSAGSRADPDVRSGPVDFPAGLPVG